MDVIPTYKKLSFPLGNLLPIVPTFALCICALFLSACNAPQETTPAQQYKTGIPLMLRAVDSDVLSVTVRINDADTEQSGVLQPDGSWIVSLDIELDQTHSYLVRWFANGSVLLMEQSGEFFADSTSMTAQPTDTLISSGPARFDVDCDDMSNLFEVENGFDPLSEPGCEDEIERPIPSATLPDLIEIPAGCFLMGNGVTDDGFFKENQRQHEVCLDAFSIGRYEVTYEQYTVYLDRFGTNDEFAVDPDWGDGTRPVREVTWQESVAYTQWLSEQTGDVYRLPTEAEWEYAARGETTTRFWTGDQLRDDEEHFNSSDTYGGGVATGQPDRDRTRPVGTLKPNRYGLYDMLGNVLEQTCSEYSEDYSGGLETRCGDADAAHVVRGGAIGRIATWSHVFTRDQLDEPDQRNGDTGFRVVREIPQ